MEFKLYFIDRISELDHSNCELLALSWMTYIIEKERLSKIRFTKFSIIGKTVMYAIANDSKHNQLIHNISELIIKRLTHKE